MKSTALRDLFVFERTGDKPAESRHSKAGIRTTTVGLIADRSLLRGGEFAAA
tara:strand:+ start:261 stop:416 length:156 start_codon:yes stop_codon:yes gene_type:complete